MGTTLIKRVLRGRVAAIIGREIAIDAAIMRQRSPPASRECARIAAHAATEFAPPPGISPISRPKNSDAAIGLFEFADCFPFNQRQSLRLFVTKQFVFQPSRSGIAAVLTATDGPVRQLVVDGSAWFFCPIPLSPVTGQIVRNAARDHSVNITHRRAAATIGIRRLRLSKQAFGGVLTAALKPDRRRPIRQDQSTGKCIQTRHCRSAFAVSGVFCADNTIDWHINWRVFACMNLTAKQTSTPA
jgi:hypothetical protein